MGDNYDDLDFEAEQQYEDSDDEGPMSSRSSEELSDDEVSDEDDEQDDLEPSVDALVHGMVRLIEADNARVKELVAM
jgi:hypothetical protein